MYYLLVVVNNHQSSWLFARTPLRFIHCFIHFNCFGIMSSLYILKFIFIVSFAILLISRVVHVCLIWYSWCLLVCLFVSYLSPIASVGPTGAGPRQKLLGPQQKQSDRSRSKTIDTMIFIGYPHVVCNALLHNLDWLKCSYIVHFRFLEHQNLRINLQKGFSFWRTLSPSTPTGELCPWTPLGDGSLSPRSLPPLCKC